MTLAYFCLGGLDLLQHTDVISEKERAAYIDWIYAQQLRTYPCTYSAASEGGGFRGSPAGNKVRAAD